MAFHVSLQFFKKFQRFPNLHDFQHFLASHLMLTTLYHLRRVASIFVIFHVFVLAFIMSHRMFRAFCRNSIILTVLASWHHASSRFISFMNFDHVA